VARADRAGDRRLRVGVEVGDEPEVEDDDAARDCVRRKRSQDL
jgi:U3 small nucleolar ribonucleoprotein component